MKRTEVSLLTLPIAVEEANELFNHAVEIDEIIQTELRKNKTPLGKIITVNTLIGLSVETYLKFFMIEGLQRIIYGHKLTELYSHFPLFLKSIIEERYRKLEKENSLVLVSCQRWTYGQTVLGFELK